ncbi:cytochrome P450 716B1 [Amborella trichopoda]|uniref:Cytochrome P450 n=1 Tax=Amborella trichopoda TaxID=13333 RepID=W1NNF5_AMBTC|nr:cytochrome P450 716B1 [Amborella trichopoda]ERM97183.1 hypothetical protein AMTR_s00119p00024530 [Amborella trichopoda]|eukprot:XP_006829767.1 cytochrome P450 716B1 [Amborella trichopoda]
MEGELMFFSLAIATLAVAVAWFKSRTRRSNHRTSCEPPGSLGWPIVGETLAILRSGRSGKPELFVQERMLRHDPDVFKTHLLGEITATFCGPNGNKFLFSNESKGLLLTCWPSSLARLFGDSFLTKLGEEAMRVRKMVVVPFLRPDTLHRLVARFDLLCKVRIERDWKGRGVVHAFPLIKKYAFSVACGLFTSIGSEEDQARLLEELSTVAKGAFQLPIYFPGTRYYRAARSGDLLRAELLKVVQSRRSNYIAGAEEEDDLMSHLMKVKDEEGNSLTDKQIADNVILLLSAGHDTSSSTMAMLLFHLAHNPHCYDRVLQEQREIAKSKAQGEFLNREDIQKMKYSWNVVNEVLRLSPPIQGTLRKPSTDLTYAGYTIPKGWKLGWSVNSTHKMDKHFPEPEKFNPARFEEEEEVEGDSPPAPYTFVPFGGGPRMCPGKDFARIQILVFLHNIVTNFRWELLFPHELISVDPMPTPSKGLPINLYPHLKH